MNIARPVTGLDLPGAKLLTDEFEIEPQKFVVWNRTIELGSGLKDVLNGCSAYYAFPLRGSDFINQFWVPEMRKGLNNISKDVKHALKVFSDVVCKEIQERQIVDFPNLESSLNDIRKAIPGYAEYLKIKCLFPVITNIFSLDDKKQEIQLEMLLFVYTRILEFTNAFLEQSSEFRNEQHDCKNILELIVREAQLQQQAASFLIAAYLWSYLRIEWNV